MAVSTATKSFQNGYLGIAYGSASEVLSNLTTAATYTGIEHKDQIWGFDYTDNDGSSPSFAVLFWRNSV